MDTPVAKKEPPPKIIGAEKFEFRPLQTSPSRETLRRRRLNESIKNIVYPSSLDFERVVNQYSIQATRDRILLVADDEDCRYPTIQGGGGGGAIHSEETTFVEAELLLPSTSPLGSEYSTFDPDMPGAAPPPPPPPPPLPGSQQSRGSSIGNRVWMRFREKTSPLGYTGHTATRWFLTMLIGLMTGCCSIIIVKCTSTIQEWRSDRMDKLWRADKRLSGVSIFTMYAGTNLALALVSSLLCIYLAPQAVGSGIPEVKAYLNGVRVKRFTSVPLFVVKIIGTILSVSSGLVIGPEGPLVHIGAILGASCTKLYSLLLGIIPGHCVCGSKLWSFIITDLSHFAHDNERRDLVSIGAAAGFAAAFGAPIGGLLFSLEEASGYFDQRMFLKTLAATVIATFCLAVHHGNLSDYSVISLGNFHSSDQNIFLNRVAEFPLYILVAVGGGVLGGIFVRCWRVLQIFRQRLFSEEGVHRRWNIAQVVFVSLLTSSLMYYIPLMPWACRRVDVNDDLVMDKSIFDPWKFHPHQFDCPPGYINELATIFFGSREEAIASILTDPMQFKPQTLWCVGVLFFFLMTLTLGVSIPTGIFMPTFLIGSSLGGAAGISFQQWLGQLGQELAPSTFALLGAAALLAGIQRSTVSLCVILVEGTGQVKVLIPVIVTVVIARYVADLISGHGLYESAMEISHYPYLEHQEKRKLDIFKVRAIMSSPPVTLGPREQAQTIVKLLLDSEHHGFPVVDPYTKKFLGLVRRDQLVALLEFGVFDEGPPSYDEDDDAASLSTNVSSSAPGSPNTDWTPRPGVGKSQLMHLAYHITDDKYDNIANREMPARAPNEKSLAFDDFDANAWLVSLRRRRKGLRGSFISEDSLPALLECVMEDDSQRNVNNKTAMAGINAKGNVYIKWLNPVCRRKNVHVAAVVNRGTYCVNDFCPVSKAYTLFTSLGLRHLIVLGGEHGGEVVGVLTRINFLKEYIEERTRCDFGGAGGV